MLVSIEMLRNKRDKDNTVTVQRLKDCQTTMEAIRQWIIRHEGSQWKN